MGKAVRVKDPGATGKLPEFEESLSAIILGAKEAVIAPMRPRLNDFDITEPQWRVLRVLNSRGKTDAKSLAEAGLLRGPSVTRILQQLETRKLIVRKTDPEDGRRTMVTLSPGGHAVVKILSRDVLHYLAEFSERFGTERLAFLTSELKALTAAIKDIE
jgi:homoprotocatechuate degradation regulator HpaR